MRKLLFFLCLPFLGGSEPFLGVDFFFYSFLPLKGGVVLAKKSVYVVREPLVHPKLGDLNEWYYTALECLEAAQASGKLSEAEFSSRKSELNGSYEGSFRGLAKTGCVFIDARRKKFLEHKKQHLDITPKQVESANSTVQMFDDLPSVQNAGVSTDNQNPGLSITQEQIDFLGQFKEIGGLSFYHYLFPDNESLGEQHFDYSHPNAIYAAETFVDGESRWQSIVMYRDRFDDDYKNNIIRGRDKTVCGGLLYFGKKRESKYAQKIRALIFDLDDVGKKELSNLFEQFDQDSLPRPTFIASSGTGVHLYYVFTDSINLFPNTRLQLNALKHDLTDRLWQYRVTSNDPEVQYQSISQGFRMVGSINAKYGSRVRVFLTGKEVDIDYLNRFVTDERSRVDLSTPFKESKMTRQQAEKKYPEWFDRVVLKGESKPRKWDIAGKVNGENPYAMYEWWVKKADQVRAGHRYYFLFAMAIYACKVDYPREWLIKDMWEVFEDLKQIKHNNPLVNSDIAAALEGYDQEYYHYTANMISRLTGIRIEKNKRNYLSQSEHLKGMRKKKAELKEQGKLKNPEGRPKGEAGSTHEQKIKDYIEKNPDASIAKIARELGISRPTVYKIVGSERGEEKKEKVKQYIREHLELTAKQVSQATGVSVPTVYKYQKEVRGEYHENNEEL